MKKTALALLLILAAATFGDIISVENDFIKVTMDDSTGRFGIGYPDGTPLIEGFPGSTSGSHITARVEGTVFSNKPGLGPALSLMDPGRIVEDYYLTIQWLQDPVRIWQKFYLMPEESLDGFVDIELMGYNDSPDSHTVGFLMYIDPLVGSNDNPILEFATGVESTSVEFTASNMPAYWTMYENSPAQDTSYALAQGVPFGSHMVFPALAGFADVSRLDSVSWYPTTLPGMPISDLGLLFRWDPIRLPPYSWYVAQIYYGAGYPSFGIETRPARAPELFSLDNPRPNPFNAEVRIPYNIEKRPQQVSWNIYDLSGRVVRHSSPIQLSPGEYEVVWNGRGDYGRDLSSGLYLLALFADGRRDTRRLLLVE